MIQAKLANITSWWICTALILFPMSSPLLTNKPAKLPCRLSCAEGPDKAVSQAYFLPGRHPFTGPSSAEIHTRKYVIVEVQCRSAMITPIWHASRQWLQDDEWLPMPIPPHVDEIVAK